MYESAVFTYSMKKFLNFISSRAFYVESRTSNGIFKAIRKVSCRHKPWVKVKIVVEHYSNILLLLLWALSRLQQCASQTKLKKPWLSQCSPAGTGERYCEFRQIHSWHYRLWWTCVWQDSGPTLALDKRGSLQKSVNLNLLQDCIFLF